MHIITEGEGEYVIQENKIFCKGIGRFFATVEGDKVTLSINEPTSGNTMNFGRGSINIGGGSNGISIRGNTILANGLSISVSGGVVNIQGPAKGITLNGKKLEFDGDQEETEDKRVQTFTLDSEPESVTVQGSASVHMKKCKKTASSLALTVQGSGDILCEDENLTGLVATVQGSGDIRMHNVNGSFLTATIQGSGEIKNKGGSKFDTIMKTVQGSGEVSGF